MKKRIAIALIFIVSALSLTACGESWHVVENVQENITIETVFERHPIGDHYYILVDKNSRVCYLEWNDVSGYDGTYGITVMLNPDGTPKIWEE